jgi:hypothetical protein
MHQFFKKLFKSDETSPLPPPDPQYSSIISQIKKRESSEDIQPGKKIHEIEYHLFSIRLDRDITKNYRITVFLGNERIYSFTVFAKKNGFDKLEEAYKQVIAFLKGERHIAQLPDSDLLKGFYFGHS